jgi:hypothetical protein
MMGYGTMEMVCLGVALDVEMLAAQHSVNELRAPNERGM